MKSWIQKVIGFGLASFFSDFSHEMTVALIPNIIAQLVGAAHAPLFLGILSSITDCFAAFLRLCSGYLSDRITHKKPLIAFGYAISAVFSMLVGFAHSFLSLLTFRTLSFTGSGLREPPRDALLTASVEHIYYGRAFGLKSAMDTLGALLGPLVGFVCASFFLMQHIFLLSLIPGILSVAAIMLLTTDIPIAPQKLRIQLTAPEELKHLPKQFLLFIGIMLIFDLGCINKLLLLGRTQELLIGTGSANIAQLLILLYAVFNATRACCEFAIGWASDYINRLLLLSLFGCGMLGLSAYLLISPHASFSYYCLIFITAAISTAAVTTLKKACAADMLPEDARGLGFGILQAVEGFAALISSALIGFLWSYYSASIGFGYVILASISSACLLILSLPLLNKRAL